MLNRYWIINARYDLLFFIFSPIFTLLLYGFYLILLKYYPEGVSGNYSDYKAAFIVFIVFSALFDQPHIFQTFVRTHRDKNEFERRPWLYTYGLVLILLSGYVFVYFKLEREVEAFFDYYGLWHMLRQNTGLLKLYHHRAGDMSPRSLRLSHYPLYTSYIAFLVLQWKFVPESAYFQSLTQLPDLVVYSLLGLFCLSVGFFLAREIMCMIYEKKFHIPKILFVLSMVAIQYFIYVHLQVAFIVSIALETIYHDVQYIGWTRFYQSKAFPEDPGFKKRWDLYSWGWGLFVGTLFILCATLEFPITYLSPLLMLIIYHYYVDGKVWKFSANPELKKFVMS